MKDVEKERGVKNEGEKKKECNERLSGQAAISRWVEIKVQQQQKLIR